jgi:hypothetical protein
MQGRLIGQSLADKTMDIQRVNTVLSGTDAGQPLSAVAPGTFIHEDSIGDHTIDDLLTIRPGRIVRGRAAGRRSRAAPGRLQIALQAIEFKLQQRESRTGITRLNKGVDEDTLNDTAKGQASSWPRPADGALHHPQLRGRRGPAVHEEGRADAQIRAAVPDPRRWRISQVDPSQWPEDMEVKVKVGLARGSKEERIMYRNMIAQVAHAADAGSGADLHLGECLQQPRGGSQGRRPRTERHLHAPRRLRCSWRPRRTRRR